MVKLVSAIIAAVLFLLVAVNISGGRINLTGLGLFFLTVAIASPV